MQKQQTRVYIEQNEVLEALHTLQDEIIRQLQATVPQTPSDVPGLLERVAVLAGKSSTGE